jgi:hypothetical protein
MAMHPLRQSGAPPKNPQNYYNHFREQSPMTSRFIPQKFVSFPIEIVKRPAVKIMNPA